MENLGHLRIFLCHSSGDKEPVRGLYKRLRDEGFDPWLDEEKLLPGVEWHQKILEAVKAADIVIVCLSPGAITKRGYVQKEIKYALDIADEQPENTIYLIPLKLEECDIPDRLCRWQWVNLFESHGYEQLTVALKQRAQSVSIRSQNSSTIRNEEAQYRDSAIPAFEFESEPENRGRKIRRKIIPAGIMSGMLGILIWVVISNWLATKHEPNPSLNPNLQNASVTKQEPGPLLIPDLKDASAYLKYGIKCKLKNDYDCAINCFNKVIDMSPQDDEAYYYRASTYQDLKNHKQAIIDYTKAIDLNPKFIDAYYNRAVSRENFQDYDQAIKDYTEVIKLKPGYLMAYMNRGGDYASKKDYDAAIKDYITAIRGNPNYDEAFYNLGTIYDQKKDFKAAIKYYSKAIQLNPKYVDAYVNRGVIYVDIDKYDLGIQDFTMAIQLDPEKAIAYDNRGIAYQIIGEQEKAQADKEKYLELAQKKQLADIE